MKIILSRKGYDTSTGGKPSPVFDNKFISIPIPEGGSNIKYQDLKISETLRYHELMNDLAITNYYEAHQDPDLRFSMSYRTFGWKPLFGQHGSAQGLLHNHGVGPGDLFLFFGVFKHAEKTSNGMRYLRSSNKIHAVFGYLEVERIIDVSKDSIPSWATYHPHVVLKDKYQGQRNVLYVARENLSFNPNRLGAECFRYHKDLVLTMEGGKMSEWVLPSCFENEEKNFNIGVNTKFLGNGALSVQTQGQGQEIFISSKPEIVKWAQDLVNKCKVYS